MGRWPFDVERSHLLIPAGLSRRTVHGVEQVRAPARGRIGDADLRLNPLHGSQRGGDDWVGGLEKHAAAVLAHQGLTASIVLAVALIVISVGVFLPAPLARSALILALVVAAFIWVFGEAFGQILAGGATDPNSAPLLALLALAYWPLATAGSRARRPQAGGPRAMAVGQAEGNDGRPEGKFA